MLHTFFRLDNNSSTFNSNDNSSIPFTYLNKLNVTPVLKLAIYDGKLDVIKNVIKINHINITKIRSEIVCELAHFGHLDALTYFIHTYHVKPSPFLMNIAARASHLEIVKWLRINKKVSFVSPDENINHQDNYLAWILRIGQLDIAKWLIEEQNFSLKNVDKKSLIEDAIRYQHLNVLIWLDDQRLFTIETSYQGKHLLVHACKYSSVRIIEWLIENKGIKPQYNEKNIRIELIVNAINKKNKQIVHYFLNQYSSMSSENVSCISLTQIKKCLQHCQSKFRSISEYVEEYSHAWQLLLQDNTFLGELLMYGSHLNFPIFLSHLIIFSHNIHQGVFKKSTNTIDNIYQSRLKSTTDYYEKKNIIKEYEVYYKNIINMMMRTTSFAVAQKINEEKFPLLSRLPDDLLYKICQFLSPPDVFKLVINQKYHQLISNPTFIAYKHEQYFGANLHLFTTAINAECYKEFKNEYLTKIKCYSPAQQQNIHACLTNNLSYKDVITFSSLESTYVTSHSQVYLYSFLLSTQRKLAIDHYISKSLQLTPSNASSFIEMTRLNDQKAMEELLKNNPELINEKDSHGQSALILAASHGYEELLIFLLTKNADLKVRDMRHHYTPLDWAIYNGHVKVIPILFEAYKIHPDFKHTISHPMIWATERAELNIMKVLYQCDKKFAEEKDELNQTPLLCAVRLGYANMVEFLLDKDPQLIYSTRDPQQDKDHCRTSFDWALETNKTEVLKVLVKYINKICGILIDNVCCTINLYAKPSQKYAMHFLVHPEYVELAKKLTDIKTTFIHSTVNTLNNIVLEILKLYNQNKNDHILISLVKNTLKQWLGRDDFLFKNSQDEILFILPKEYGLILDITEKNATLTLSNSI